MRYLAIGLIVLLSCTGCRYLPKNDYEKRTERVQQDIELLKLEVRREKLMNELEDLEGSQED